jgi:hypothetical protein
MTYPYVVILKKEGERATDVLSVLLCLASAAIFGYTIVGIRLPGFILPMIAAFVLIGLIYNTVSARRKKRVRYRYLLLLTALGWFVMPSPEWIGILFIVLAFLEHQTKRPLEIGFDHDRVVINSLIRRRHDWSVFNNVILRDGLLTLDFKNNRLIQREIADDDDEDDADEEEFNAYCRDRLAAAGNPQPAAYGK